MKKKGLTLVVLIVLLSFVSAWARSVFSQGVGAQIDLYTQREPYSGRGPNMPSDAFGPGEEVRIFAYVAFNECPIQGILVAFGVFGPEDPSGRTIFYRSAMTDENGIAMISFRLPYLNETNFGNWTVLGNTDIAGSTVQDIVIFRVGWLVEILSVRTLNEMNETQTEFTHRSIVGVELVLISIAMTEKSATISVMANDSLNVRVATAETDNFIVPPNEVPVISYSYFSIPDTAHVGLATISAGLYTAPVVEGGTAYSPEMFAYFTIITRDVGITNVIPSTQNVRRGENVLIDVNVRNKGSKTESFRVITYCNGTVIYALQVEELAPHSNMTVQFTWNTSAVEQGSYVLSAYAEPVPGETNLADNTFTDGNVNVRNASQPVQPVLFHDIATVNLTPSSTLVSIGTTINITAIVTNYGNYTESFNVTVYYDSNVISTIDVLNLGPGDTRSLVFHWNTQNVVQGNYTLMAIASGVPDEADLLNNSFVDGVVRLIVSPGSWFVFEWWHLLLLLLLLLIVIILILWLYRRRKKKRSAGGSFNAGWAAWYYQYGLPKRYPKDFDTH